MSLNNTSQNPRELALKVRDNSGGGSGSGISYTEDERAIGSYLGKTLYQKTIISNQIPSSNNDIKIDANIENISDIVNFFGTVKLDLTNVDGTTVYMPICMADSNNTIDANIIIKPDETMISFKIIVQAWRELATEWKLTIQYTKD